MPTLAAVSGSALTLLVPGVVTDDHDVAVATNHLALVTDLLDTRLDLHGVYLHCLTAACVGAFTCSGRRYDHGIGRTG